MFFNYKVAICLIGLCIVFTGCSNEKEDSLKNEISEGIGKVKLDVLPPVLTITGGNEVTVTQGTKYIDPEVIATDETDGNITVESSGMVDTNIPGNYNITYTATDDSGNTVTAMRTVTVTVSDIKPPVITLKGDANVSILVDEAYVDSGAIASDDVDGNVTVIKKGTVDTTKIGDYNITYTATDSHNNTAIAIRIISVKIYTIIHEGITYGKVTSPRTGKVWLDRNLGAAQICENFDDDACFGDYYQWGRNYDGHEAAESTTVGAQAEDVEEVGHNNFIAADPDWGRSADENGSIRSDNWSKIDGSSVCPIGFRVPTIVELNAELFDTDVKVKNGMDAFKSFLKLPSAGYREITGFMMYVNKSGRIWASSISFRGHSRVAGFNRSTSGSSIMDKRSRAQSVRCIKN